MRVSEKSFFGFGFKEEVELGGKTKRPYNAKSIFGKTLTCLANTTDGFIAQIFLSAKGVDKTSLRMNSNCIDGEISPGKILFDGGNKGYLVGMTLVGI